MYTAKEAKIKRAEQELFCKDNFSMEFYTQFISKTEHNNGWECFHFIVYIKNYITSKGYSINYYQGIGHVYKDNKRTPIKPLPFAVLSSIYFEDTGGETFEEWCNEYGYSTDSRSALDLYLRCQKQSDDFKKIFPRVCLEQYEEITQY